jgi:hypothetical protein
MAHDATTVRPAAADGVGRTLGIAVFLLGVALLVVVFGLAYRDLIAAVDGVTFSRLLALPATLVFKASLLLVMGLVASAIANKGIALYRAARQPVEG